jgi:hypothetical protein
MAIDFEYVQNGNVFEILTTLGNKIEIEKGQSVGAASDHV